MRAVAIGGLIALVGTRVPATADDSVNYRAVSQNIDNTIQEKHQPTWEQVIQPQLARRNEQIKAAEEARLAEEARQQQVAQQSLIVAVAQAPSNNSGNVALAQSMAAERGWTGSNWNALYQLWMRESGFNTHAQNPHSAACGIPQNISGCTYGFEPSAQITWGLDYIAGRYGSPNNAWAHSQSTGWY